MLLIENPAYLNSLQKLYRSFPHWGELNGKTLLLSGATGMIGSFLTDAIMLRNERLPEADRCKVVAVGRNAAAAAVRFPRWMNRRDFRFVAQDISRPPDPELANPHFIIHAASTTHPVAYASRPIETILTNVLGTRNLLELAAQGEGKRFLLLSSVEIYGENRGGAERFNERYCGYLDCNTLRAGYPEAKRVSEALCQAYIAEKGVDARILRLPRCYGPSMRMSDSKAIAQFLKKAAAGEDIVLKSAGNQLYSYAHVCDAAQGILWTMLRGKTGDAYNLGDAGSDVTLKALAEIAAAYSGARVVFELPDEQERKGYSTATRALLDGEKLKELGWSAAYDIRSGICETIGILREIL